MDSRGAQALAGAGVALLGILMAWGAWDLPAEAGYSGVGPNFLPWVVSVALMLCGVLLSMQALRGRAPGTPSAARSADTPQANWRALVWMVMGVLGNAALITTAGFALSCALCFTLALRGLRVAEGTTLAGRPGLMQVARDFGIGLAIALPVYWVFTKLLGIGLPGLTTTGWL